MELGLVFLVFAVVGLALFIWWVVVLIEALRVPSATWSAAGQSQILYVLLMVLVGLIGTIVYIAVARPALRGAGANV